MFALDGFSGGKLSGGFVDPESCYVISDSQAGVDSKGPSEAQGAEAGPGFTNDQLISIGEQVGLTSETFASCVNDGTYDGWVSNVAQSGVDEGVNTTPTFFVNGEQVQLEVTGPRGTTTLGRKR